jgi:phosphoglycolate phosphatase
MRYKLVIFDFDGTIADTSEGIMDSHRFALVHMGRKVPCDEELYSLIGGNLLNIYIDHFGFSDSDAREAVKIYRQRYAEIGIHKASLYHGFKELLICLKLEGMKVGIATLKAEVFAKKMVEELGIAELFDCICGMDSQDGLSKSGLVNKCVSECQCTVDDTVLVGDTIGDLNGAQEAGTSFIGVSYGFGFKKNIDYDFICCASSLELQKKLLREYY